MVIGNPVGVHRLLLADSQSQGLLLCGEKTGDGIAVALVPRESLGGSSEVVGVAVGVVGVVLAAVEVLQRGGDVAQIELRVFDGRVVLLPGGVGWLDGTGAVEGISGELIVACWQTGQFLPDVKGTGELLGRLAVVAHIGCGDIRACPYCWDIRPLPADIVAGEGTVLDEEGEVGWLPGACPLELLLLIVGHGAEQLLEALAAGGCGAAADGTRGRIVGLCQRAVAGILVVVLHFLDQVLEFLQVGNSLEPSIIVHGGSAGCHLLHL